MWYGNWCLASNDVASLKRNNFPVMGDRVTEPAEEIGPEWERIDDLSIPGYFSTLVKTDPNGTCTLPRTGRCGHGPTSPCRGWAIPGS
jgi:hypothetical protein